ncbi:HDOD domain-containing protein [Dechloromonas sp.]|uniref:HDOD domain-containing protein n=1 Tax=Dechloromonas sp. TaxID=1917218 RepID=UPI001213C71E|nr:HDOD domain-containing protein [Dechloromonas sp.]MBU3696190.1 HDOD domain-containing protein [Dechloromonas sp.]TEX46201.1 MAG: hypothetical protein CFR70_11925 [Rhodocyclaceae bacterium]
MATRTDNKTGDDLKAQRFQMLEDIAKELSGEVVFPTYFDAVLRLRKVLQDPNETIGSISSAVSLEPLISAKLLHLANSVAFNPQGNQVVDLKSAVSRLGLNAVRSAALSIVIGQLLRAKGMASFADLTHKLWEHSVHTAAAARVLAREHTRFNVDEAMLAGLIHDLGAFYMLYRATQYEELRERPDTVRYLIVQWHESIGISLLNALGLPEEIVNATEDHDRLRPAPEMLRTLSDVIYVANMMSGGHFERLMRDLGSTPDELDELSRRYGYLQPEIDTLYTEIKNSLS